MSNTSSKLRGLVEALYKRTIDDDIVWEVSSDQVSVNSVLSDYKVEISPEAGDVTFGTDIRITIFAGDGTQVTTFTDSTLTGKPVSIKMDSYYSVMNALLELARRQATGADRAIQKLLDLLGGLPVIDPPEKKNPFDELDDSPF